MFVLCLIWLASGFLIGALALAARLRPAWWGRRGWLWMLGLGALAAQLGGWLGTLLMGRLYSTADALWVAALLVVAVPWLWVHRSKLTDFLHLQSQESDRKKSAAVTVDYANTFLSEEQG